MRFSFSVSVTLPAITFLLVSTASSQQASLLPFFLPDHPFEQPKRRDVQRSPCPFINTLANHGFINRSGKNIDIFELADIMTDIFDISAAVTTNIAHRVVDRGLTKTTSRPGKKKRELLDLDDLFLHRSFEHDASLTRRDHFFGTKFSKSPNDKLIDNLLATTTTAAGADSSSVVTKADIKKHQRNRIIHSRLRNPTFNITGQESGLAGEAVFLLALGSQSDLGFVAKDRLDTLLRKEKLPDDYQPGKLRDPNNFVPFDFSYGNIAASVRIEFLDNVKAALAEDADSMKRNQDMNTHNETDIGDDPFFYIKH